MFNPQINLLCDINGPLFKPLMVNTASAPHNPGRNQDQQPSKCALWAKSGPVTIQLLQGLTERLGCGMYSMQYLIIIII